ncbi:hypothetical protein [Streptomyces sp. NPDC048106]|uniref:YncE family protein n=1 Tax=Streptomyces sp. NPDC048106 TaxID=3155750 RepID=UPI003454E2D1
MPVSSSARKALLPVVLLSALALPGPAATARAAAEPATAELPISSAADIVVDHEHQRLYISDPADSSVLVTDYAGSVVTDIPEQPGAAGLALSDTFLYVALPDADAISVINTQTLQETARYSTGRGIEPRHLAYDGGRLWFGYDTSLVGKLGSVESDGFVRLDLDGPHGWQSAPFLVMGGSGTLVAGAPGRTQTGQSVTELQVYDATPSTPVPTAYTSQPVDPGSAGLSDMALTNDGKDIVTAGTSSQGARLFRTSDLGADGTCTTAAAPDAVVTSVDGRIVTGSAGPTAQDLSLFLPGDPAALRTYDLSGDVVPAGLAWDPFTSDLFALTQPSGGGPVTLHVTTPAKADTTLTLQAPDTARRDEPLTLTGTLDSPLAIPDATEVRVTRTDAASPDGVTVGTAGVSSLNTFTIDDVPPASGTVTYTVTYAGDAAHNAATATATVRID